MGEIKVDVSFEAGRAARAIECAAQDVSEQMTAPHVLMRPVLRRDGDKWSALYGDNIADGVVGYGSTPAEACAAFDRAWRGEEDGRDG